MPTKQTRQANSGDRPVAAQAARATAMRDSVRAIAPREGPQGRKLASNIGPGMLCPGAGKQVQRTGKPVYCGTMTGRAFDVTEHPNSRDAARISLRFAGECIAIDHTGKVSRGAEWYLPPTPARAIKAALRVSGGHPIPFALEIWCEPDEEGRPASPLGYSYVSYDRVPAHDNDPLMALAYEAGILERPASAALPAPSEPDADDVDPETGEVRSPSVAASQAGGEPSLTSGSRAA